MSGDRARYEGERNENPDRGESCQCVWIPEWLAEPILERRVVVRHEMVGDEPRGETVGADHRNTDEHAGEYRRAVAGTENDGDRQSNTRVHEDALEFP